MTTLILLGLSVAVVVIGTGLTRKHLAKLRKASPQSDGKPPPDWHDPRPIANVIGLIWLGVITAALATEIGFWFALAIGMLVLGLIIYQGLKEIRVSEKENEYYAVLLLTVLGNPFPAPPLRPGWNFFLFAGFLFGYIRIDARKKNTDLPDLGFTTPDLVELTSPMSFTYSADASSGQALFNLVKSGLHAGVEDIQSDILADRLRSWGMSDIEGPQSWVEAKGTDEEAIAVLIKRLLGQALAGVDSGIFSTTDLLGFLKRPRKKPTDSQKERVGKDWEIIQDIWDSYQEGNPGDQWKKAFGDITKKALNEQVDKRRKVIEKVRQGNGDFKNFDLGIVLHRLNFSEEIKAAHSHVQEDAERQTREKLQREYEKIQVRARISQVKLMKKALPGLTDKEALKSTQLEVGKLTEEVHTIDSTPGVPVIITTGRTSKPSKKEDES